MLSVIPASMDPRLAIVVEEVQLAGFTPNSPVGVRAGGRTPRWPVFFFFYFPLKRTQSRRDATLANLKAASELALDDDLAVQRAQFDLANALPRPSFRRPGAHDFWATWPR